MNPTRTPLFLMANLGSEVTRLVGCEKSGDTALMLAALERARRTIADIKAFPEMLLRYREIDILADVLSDFEREQRKYDVDMEALTRYFEPFALRLFAQ